MTAVGFAETPARLIVPVVYAGTQITILATLGACPSINVFSLWIPGEPGSLCVQSDHAADTLSASDGHGQCPDGRPPGQGLLRVHRVPSPRMRP
jgi:hypothetical protein